MKQNTSAMKQKNVDEDGILSMSTVFCRPDEDGIYAPLAVCRVLYVSTSDGTLVPI